MRIAYLFSRFPVLSQTFCVTEIRALEDLGCEIVICSIHPPETLLRHSTVSLLKAPTLYNPDSKHLRALESEAKTSGQWPAEIIQRQTAVYGAEIKSATRARNALWFARELTSRCVSHVHVHFANRATHTALFLKKLTGLPFSFTAHAQDFMVDFPSRDLLAELIVEAEFVIAVSEWSRNVLIKMFPFAEAKIRRVYNGIDLSLFTPGSPPMNPPGVPVKIFSVGRLVEFKGFDTLIEACSLLRRRGVSFNCEIAGAGPLHDSLQRLISEMQLDDMVQLIGPLPQQEVLERMRRCDLFALSSRIDSKGACDVLPTVITEAMACGRPVISTQTAGIPEQVLDGRTGYLTAPDDPEAFAAALERLIAEPSRACEFGNEGRSVAQKLFDVRKSGAELLGCFESCADRPQMNRQRHFSHAKLTAHRLVLLDEWPSSKVSISIHRTLVAANAARDLELVPLQRGAPPLQPPPWPFGLWGLRPRPVEIPEPPRPIFLPPPSVIEAVWIARGYANDEFLRLEKRLPADFQTFELYNAARWLIALQMSVPHWSSIPILAVGRQACLISWIRHQINGTCFDVLNNELSDGCSSEEQLAKWLKRT